MPLELEKRRIPARRLEHCAQRSSFGWLSLIFFLGPLAYLLFRAPSVGSYLYNSDHGYQLALGRQLLLGKLPFKELFFHYGPLSAYTSLAGIKMWDSPLSETIICCLGYALALFCLGAVLRHRASAATALIGVAGGLLLLARFHKWYYWLFPLLCLYLLDRAQLGKRSRLLSVLLGISIGVAGLYRLDLGVACLTAGVIGQILMNLACNRGKFADLPFLVAGSFVSAAIWFLCLVAQSGWPAIYEYCAFFVAGVRTECIHQSMPPSPVLACVLLASGLAYCFSLGYALWKTARLSDAGEREAVMMCGVAAVFGLCLFPQALHRCGTGYLLQVLPPAILTAGILVAHLAGSTSPSSRASGRPVSPFGLAAYALLLLSLSGLLHGGADLAPSDNHLRARYRDLAIGVSVNVFDPVQQVIAKAEAMTSPLDSVLILPQGNLHPTQLYYLINRPMAGLMAMYLNGLFSEDDWRLRNFNAIKLHPPTIVIGGEDLLGPPLAARWPKFYPEMYAFVRENYPKIAYRKGGWVILSRR